MTSARKVIYGAAVFFALMVAVAGKCPSFGKPLLADVPAGGDLYHMSALEHFREPIRVLPKTATAPLQCAEIVTMGDSFFNSSLDSDLFATELAKRSGWNVHNVPLTPYFEPCSYPLAYLRSIGYGKDRLRILVLETVERSVMDRAVRYNGATRTTPNPTADLAGKLLQNDDVTYFFKSNLVIYPLIRRLKQLRFDWFGITDQGIGAYNEDPAMLFFRGDVDFAARPKPDAVLDAVAGEIARCAEQLRREFGMELLYVAMPDKYSVYRDYVPSSRPYDRFLPRLVQRLRARGVHAVDIYGAYQSYRRSNRTPLYYEGDTHYTPTGKALLVDECLREIRSMKGQGAGTGPVATGG